MNAQQTKRLSNVFLTFETKVQQVQQQELKRRGLKISHRELIYIVFIKNNEGKRMLEIGKKMGLSKGAFSNTVKTLVEKKLVKKEKSTNDKRIMMLTLDVKGEEAYAIHGKARKRITKTIGKILTTEEKEGFIALCDKLVASWKE